MNPSAKPVEAVKTSSESEVTPEEAQAELRKQLKALEKLKQKQVDRNYRGDKIRAGYRGKDFEIVGRDGKTTFKCHQTVSGTLYLYVGNTNTRRKVTEQYLRKLEEEIGAVTPTSTDPELDKPTTKVTDTKETTQV